MEFIAKDIAEALGGTVEGDENCVVVGVSELDAGKPKTLSFFANPKYEKYVYTTEAAIVLVNNDFIPTENVSATLIRVPDAYAAMASLLQMYEESRPQKVGVEHPSFVSKTTTIGKNAYIGAFAYIGENVKIGDNVKIYPNTYIGDNVKIADGCQIFAGVKIYSHTEIGAYCNIHAGSVIGSDGFGFAPQKDGTYQKIPQLGKVILEDHVEIGANTCVDRAMMGATVIKSGAKLDNLVQIAHNCEVGENTVIAAQSGIAGSSKLGQNCMLGGQAGVAGHITLGNNVYLQAKTGVNSNVGNEQQLMGTPAISLSRYYKSYALFKQLPELAKDIKQLKKQLKDFASEK